VDPTVRWIIKVSLDTDRSLRSHLKQRGMKKGDLSRFIERAVQKEILVQTVADVKQRNAGLPPGELQALIDEALVAARREAPIAARTTGKSRRVSIVRRNAESSSERR